MNVEDLLADRFIAHQVRLLRLAAGVSRIVKARLARLTEELMALGREYVKAERTQAEMLLSTLRARTLDLYLSAARDVRAQLEALGRYEVDATYQIMTRGVPAELAIRFRGATATQIIASLAQPIQGATIEEWFQTMANATFERARKLVRLGRFEDQTIGQMVSALRGAVDVARTQAEAVVRTLVNGTATSARQLVLSENADVLDGVRWVSTLDARTTPICQERDGEVFPVNSGPRPPAHINCRSTIVPVINDAELRRLGFKGRGERAAAGGPVPAGWTYNDWLKRQPLEVQEEVLGKKRAQLFRKGGLELKRFIDDDGTYYTLDELKRREARAWSRVFSG